MVRSDKLRGEHTASSMTAKAQKIYNNSDFDVSTNINGEHKVIQNGYVLFTTNSIDELSEWFESWEED